MTIAMKIKALLHHNTRTLRIVCFFRIIRFQIIRNFWEKNEASNSVTKLKKIEKTKKENKKRKKEKEKEKEKKKEKKKREKGNDSSSDGSDRKIIKMNLLILLEQI